LFKIAVLVSGNGSNLQAIIDAIENHELEVELSLVISSRTDAYALKRAQQHNIKTYTITKTNTDRSNAISELCQQFHVDLIVLAGYLGILKGEILKSYKNKIINIHPALLPKYGGRGMYGLHVHQAVINAHESESGCTVHFVNEEIDAGAIILQAKVNVTSDDTPESLAKKVAVHEHKLLLQAIKLFL
jgi:phosphoribosylglycinamide formyltransferase-1